MDWENNSTNFTQIAKSRTPDIFTESFDLLGGISYNSTTATYYDNTTYALITDIPFIIQPDELNKTLRTHPALTLFTGNLDKKYVERINEFWLQFSPPAEKTHMIIAVIYVLLTIFGCCGNALVIFMFIRCKSLRTPANTLVINLAISDFLMIGKSPIAAYNSYNLGPALGDLGCRIYGFLGGLTGCVSITTLTAISIDRYHVIVYPLEPLRGTTKIRTRLILLFLWTYSLIFASIPALDIGLSQYVPEGFLTTCSFDYLSKKDDAKIFMFTFFIGAYILPFLIISYCYFYILKVVISANSIQSSKDKNKTEFKLTAIVSGIISLWFLAWTPYAVVALIGISGNEYYLTPLCSMVPAIFCKISACINPYVYAVTHPRFRLEFRKMFLGEDMSVKRTSTFRSSTLSSIRHHSVKAAVSATQDQNMQNAQGNQIAILNNTDPIKITQEELSHSSACPATELDHNLTHLQNVELSKTVKLSNTTF
ncbi:opsin, ultraviolet-sensitive [Condylostylus longicornis]|uniref:opsin, ultraviolet-sensitive n=1 Tax=Condylostylus longicornis TaxID=2530218 RepID=UPI00244E2B42|nr:opsin, ultraviolet-sensitive [Condylostylus longicornis]XP_055377261.1 opsin, ultraviolet-sensitive [Condylostylus longicornis]